MPGPHPLKSNVPVDPDGFVGVTHPGMVAQLNVEFGEAPVTEMVD